MNINHTHITHYNVVEDVNAVPCYSLVQLAGPFTSCKRLAFYFGLELQMTHFSEDSFDLITIKGEKIGQVHKYEDEAKIVFKKDFFEKEAA